jgi:hypothetical protein
MYAIDLNGLNPSDRSRIRAIGFDAWLDETADKQLAKPQSRTPSNPASHITRKQRTCGACGKTFYAVRSDAKYCSRRCRQRACYHAVAIPTDNAFCEAQNQ